jgi:type VI secretion system secreted protein Hcp
MAIDMFMRVDGVTGESKDSNHSGWTNINSFSWGASQPGDISNGGNGAGKVNFYDLHVNADIDKACTALLKYCANGKHLSKVELSICKAGGSQVEYSKITLEDVLVTSVQYTGTNADNSLVGMTYSFQSAKIKQQYWEQSSDGSKGAESSVGWNIKQNVEA